MYVFLIECICCCFYVLLMRILLMWIYDSLTAVFIHLVHSRRSRSFSMFFGLFPLCSYITPTLLLYADVIILCCCLVMCLTIILCDGIMILCSLSCWLSVSFFILVLYFLYPVPVT